MREFYRRNEGVVLDAHLMVVLVPFLESSHDRNRCCRRRFIDYDHLEPSLQRLVGLEVLLIFIQGRRTDGAEFTAGQGRLEDV